MRTATWIKMLLGGGAMCVGGPALIYYVMPSEEELFSRYNPELQRRSLENRKEKQEDFDKFVTRLKEYSRSEKPIWTAWEQDHERRRKLDIQREIDDRREAERQADARRKEIRDSLK